MSTILNRSIAPQARQVGTPKMVMPETVSLSNGIKVHFLSSGTQEVTKLELLFQTGTISYPHPLVPGMAVSMLKEGTSSFNATQIAEWVDNYGAFLETESGKDYSSISLYSLNRFLPVVLPLLSEIINNSIIPSEEFEINRNNKIQKFLVGLEKVGFVAGKRFQELLFGEKGYGIPVNSEHYNSLDREEVFQFYKSNILTQAFEVYASGFIPDDLRSLIIKEFSGFSVNPSVSHPVLESADMIKGSHFIEKENAMQSAIRIGRPLFTRNHHDYFETKVLLTILGGYFGSRLMSNIREDKGYTYGIGAGLALMKNAGYFYISTEVGAAVCKNAIDEIYKEIKILRDEPVGMDELGLVQNYMLGSLLKSFEGPFECIERFKTIYLDGFSEDYYDRYAQAIKNVTPQRIQELANRWLRREDFTELVVGKI
jgi:predicted Zn-dependent peptidase